MDALSYSGNLILVDLFLMIPSVGFSFGMIDFNLHGKFIRPRVYFSLGNFKLYGLQFPEFPCQPAKLKSLGKSKYNHIGCV